MSTDGDRELRFGYFFTDRSATRLSAFAKAAEAAGYRAVALYKDEEAEASAWSLWRLHLTRVLRNSEARDRRMELVAIGREHEIEVFDGWEVGSVDGSRRVRLTSVSS